MVQDMTSCQWSKGGTVISVRTAQDGKGVSYLLNFKGFETARHRKYMRKLNLPDDAEVQRAAPRETGLEAEVACQETQQLRRSERLRAEVQDEL